MWEWRNGIRSCLKNNIVRVQIPLPIRCCGGMGIRTGFKIRLLQVRILSAVPNKIRKGKIMNPVIEKIKDIAWYCENSNDTYEMIEFLESNEIRWQDGERIKSHDYIHHTVYEGYIYLLSSSYRLMFGSNISVNTTKVTRGEDLTIIPLVSWQEIKQLICEEPVSLSSYLLEVN